jgi:protocatechuate 3,4-dioxygenase beta subunit
LAVGGDDPKPITVRGRVLDQRGQAVPKAELWLPLRWNPEREVHGHADEGGEYQLTVPRDWLHPVAQRNQWTIWAYAKGHALGTASARSALFEGSKDAVDIRLAAPTKTSFVVLDPDGKPLAGAAVSPYRIHTVGHALVPAALVPRLAAVTDGAGRATLPAVPTKGLSTARVASREYGTQDQTLDNEREVVPLERTIRLRAVGRVEGQVFAEKREWVRGIRFEIENWSEGINSTSGFASVESDADGKFVVPQIATGLLRIADHLDKRLPARALLPRSAEVVAGETTSLEINLVPGVLARGRVQFADSGKPLAGAYVGVHYGVFRQFEDSPTDTDGQFEVRVLPGEVSQTVYFPGPFQPQFVARSTEAVGIPDGVEKFDLPTIRVVKTVRYEGRVIDNDGKPVAGALVFARDGGRGMGAARTDREGKFSAFWFPDVESFRVRLNDAIYDAMLEKTDPLLLKLPVAIKTP